jgi:two-component system response regulator NreC
MTLREAHFVSILLADDHEILRQGLQRLLGTQPDFKVVGQAQNGLEAVELAERLHPDVVIVDILMPGLNGNDVTRQIKQRLPNTRMIVLSMYDDDSYVVSALQNGANGYVLKSSSATDLVQAVRAALAGQRFLSPPLAERAIQAYIHQAQNKVAGEHKVRFAYDLLTLREREVLHLSVEGLSGPEIANQISISTRTVETHRANLMHKLGLHSQAELVAYAREHGIIA